MIGPLPILTLSLNSFKGKVIGLCKIHQNSEFAGVEMGQQQISLEVGSCLYGHSPTPPLEHSLVVVVIAECRQQGERSSTII